MERRQDQDRFTRRDVDDSAFAEREQKSDQQETLDLLRQLGQQPFEKNVESPAIDNQAADEESEGQEQDATATASASVEPVAGDIAVEGQLDVFDEMAGDDAESRRDDSSDDFVERVNIRRQHLTAEANADETAEDDEPEGVPDTDDLPDDQAVGAPSAAMDPTPSEQSASAAEQATIIGDAATASQPDTPGPSGPDLGTNRGSFDPADFSLGLDPQSVQDAQQNVGHSYAKHERQPDGSIVTTFYTDFTGHDSDLTVHKATATIVTSSSDDGTTTQVVLNPDGTAQSIVQTDPNGKKTTLTLEEDGISTTTIEHADGSKMVRVIVENEDGSITTTETTYDKDGNVVDTTQTTTPPPEDDDTDSSSSSASDSDTGSDSDDSDMGDTDTSSSDGSDGSSNSGNDEPETSGDRFGPPPDFVSIGPSGRMLEDMAEAERAHMEEAKAGSEITPTPAGAESDAGGGSEAVVAAAEAGFVDPPDDAAPTPEIPDDSALGPIGNTSGNIDYGPEVVTTEEQQAGTDNSQILERTDSQVADSGFREEFAEVDSSTPAEPRDRGEKALEPDLTLQAPEPPAKGEDSNAFSVTPPASDPADNELTTVQMTGPESEEQAEKARVDLSSDDAGQDQVKDQPAGDVDDEADLEFQVVDTDAAGTVVPESVEPGESPAPEESDLPTPPEPTGDGDLRFIEPEVATEVQISEPVAQPPIRSAPAEETEPQFIVEPTGDLEVDRISQDAGGEVVQSGDPETTPPSKAGTEVAGDPEDTGPAKADASLAGDPETSPPSVSIEEPVMTKTDLVEPDSSLSTVPGVEIELARDTEFLLDDDDMSDDPDA